MRPVIRALERARRGGARHRARLRADARAAASASGIAHAAIGRHRGGRLAAKGARAGVALAGARALGARAALRRRARPRLQRRHGRRAAARDPVRDDVRLRVGDACSTRSTAAWRRRVVVPEAIPPERLRPLRRDAGEAAPLPGAQGGVLPRRLRARPRRPRASSASTRARRSRSCARRPRCRSTTASSTRCSPGVLERLRGRRRPSCCRARPSSAPSSPRPAASSCPSAPIDAQSLVAFADVVVSAGGTMNREAVALGTPVWTTFEGRLGAVDERLIAEGRLRRLERPEDVERRASATGGRGARARPARPRGASPTCSSTRLGRARGRLECRGCAAGCAPAAVLPVHRHSAPQVLVDAGLVALSLLPRLPAALRRRGHAALPGPLRAHDRLRGASAASFCFAHVRALPALDALRDAARLPADRARPWSSRRSPCSATSRWCSRSSCSTAQGFASVNVPTGVLALYGLLMLVFVGGWRFLRADASTSARCAASARAATRAPSSSSAPATAGACSLREILRNPELGYRPVGFVDDDPRKRGARIDRGLAVLGSTRELAAHARRRRARRGPDRRPVGAGHDARARRHGVPRARRARAHDADRLRAAADGRAAAAPGARGARSRTCSAASRCAWRSSASGATSPAASCSSRARAARSAPSCAARSRASGRAALVLLDHAEDNLFEIHRELVADRHALNTVAVLADCKEGERMREVFREHRPAIVFHAAAYKHVGLMEDNPVEAVRNNALATRVMCQVAGEAGTRAFVLVSTDKAVSPATVMGASKALAEWAVEAADQRFPSTTFCAVRFGNVLGSSGSVVPIFRRQIAAGGPRDRHARGHDALLHDDPGGGAARHPRGLARRGRRDLRARDGRAGADRRPRARHDPAVRAGARPRHRDRDRRPARRGEAPRGAVQPVRAPAADARPEDPPRRAPAARPGVGARDVRPGQLARPRRRRRRAGRQGRRAGRRPAAAPPDALDGHGRRAAAAAEAATDRPRTAPRIRAPSPCPGSPSPSRARSRSTVPTSASPRFFGLAVLSLLYFAQARELKRLREWAGRAPERAQELEQRVVAQADAARRPPRRPPRRAGWRRCRIRRRRPPRPRPPLQRRRRRGAAGDGGGRRARRVATRRAARRPRNGHHEGPVPPPERRCARRTARQPATSEAAVRAAAAAGARRRPARPRSPGAATEGEPATPASDEADGRASGRRAATDAAPRSEARGRRGRAVGGRRRRPGADQAARRDAKRAPRPPAAAPPWLGGGRGGRRRRVHGPRRRRRRPGRARADEAADRERRRRRAARKPMPPAVAGGVRARRAPAADERDAEAAAGQPRSPRATPVQRPSPRRAPRRSAARAQPSAVPRRPGAAARRAGPAPPAPGGPLGGHRRAARRHRRARPGRGRLRGLAAARRAATSRSRPTRARSPRPRRPRRRPQRHAAPRRPRETVVAVLNGTTFNGLAGTIADQLGTAGYQRGATVTNPDQTLQTSTVFYADGARANARRIARRLNVADVRADGRRRRGRSRRTPTSSCWPEPTRPRSSSVTFVARAVFVLLVGATFAAFFVAQRLKSAPPRRRACTVSSRTSRRTATAAATSARSGSGSRSATT